METVESEERFVVPIAIGHFKPFVSIIIPTRNEEKYIGQCLDSLALQTYPHDRFEVIILDGLSNDNTLEIARTFAGKINLRIEKNPLIKHVYAFNSGIKKAKGDYFVLVSGHSFIGRDFIAKNVETFSKVKKTQSKLAAVGGSLEMIYENSFGMLVSSLFASPFSGASGFWRSIKPHFDKTVVFGFYDKKSVKEVNCFDEDMIKGQDFELNLRLLKNGYRLFSNPEIRPFYHVRSTFTRFLTQTFDNGAAKALCIRKKYFNPIWLMPSAFFLYQLSLLVSLLLPYDSVALWVPFAFYWLANVMASIKTQKKKRLALLSPFMFWILHTLTGIGFLSGLLLGKKSVML
jgi:glycosyltransferase involved in cell wall biosynthesis